VVCDQEGRSRHTRRDRVGRVRLDRHGAGSGGHAPNAARLVKPLFDGIISAFHAYSGPPILAEVSERIGRALDLEPTEVLALLTDEGLCALDSRAVVRLHGPQGVA